MATGNLHSVSTLSKKYAKALYGALEPDQRPALLAVLQQLVEVLANNQDLASALSSPVYVLKDKLAVLKEIAGDDFEKWPAFERFLTELLKNGRFGELAGVVKAADELLLAAENIVPLTFVTAREQSAEQKAAWSSLLADRLQNKIRVDWQVRHSLIGGCLIRCGDIVIDLSVFSRLKGLRRSLLSQ